jgi:hypothetical protein
MTSWIYMTHPGIAGAGKFPDEPGVREAQEARGWVEAPLPRTGEWDPDAPQVPEPAAAPIEQPFGDEGPESSSDEGQDPKKKPAKKAATSTSEGDEN